MFGIILQKQPFKIQTMNNNFKKILGFSIWCCLVGIMACEEEEIPIVEEEEPEVVEPCDTTFILNYSFDTIYPSEYLMYYPGSWWSYSNGTTKTCTEWKAVSIALTTKVGNCVTVNEDMHILPHGNFGVISNIFNVSSYSNFATTHYSQIIGINLGDTFFNTGYFANQDSDDNSHSYNRTTRKYSNHFDTLTVQGRLYFDVMQITQTFKIEYGHWGGSGPWDSDTLYYARGVGLIKVIDGSLASPAFTVSELTDHFIAPH